VIYTGISGSPGIAMGTAYVHVPAELTLDQSTIPGDRIGAEKKKLAAGIVLAAKQIRYIREKAYVKAGEKEAQVFDAHLGIVEDPALVREIEELMDSEHITAAWAAQRIISQYVTLFSNMDDPYMRERFADIRDVGERLVRNIVGEAPQGLDHLRGEAIVIADDLTPSDTISLDKDYVKGFVVNTGGRTSHAAILARTLEIPAVMGVAHSTDLVKDGDFLIVDGSAGRVFVNPSPDIVDEYRQKLADYLAYQQQLEDLASLPAVTTDGRQVEIMANIGAPPDVDAAMKRGARGVGLYRTEFLYMEHEQLPDEETQFAAYRTVAEKFRDLPVIIRTLDIGGDKTVKSFELPAEMNPFLGWRAIRICLARPDIFKTQLRAILRASAYGKVWIMFPMISGIGEVRAAKAILEEVKAQLRAEGKSFDENLKVGIMVEVPSAAITADHIAREVDFFSIGTNDLCQYTLAVDRVNEKISALYQPLHPAVLHLVANIVRVAQEHGIIAGMCGEMAGDPLAIIILLGLGLEEFSMSTSAMLTAKKIIRSVSYEQAKAIAREALLLETPEEITQYSANILKELGLF
jgi:phosphotransferase system enzyme I (PtsI)